MEFSPSSQAMQSNTFTNTQTHTHKRKYNNNEQINQESRTISGCLVPKMNLCFVVREL